MTISVQSSSLYAWSRGEPDPRGVVEEVRRRRGLPRYWKNIKIMIFSTDLIN